MNPAPEDWRRIFDLYDQAIELPEERRGDWLDDACRADPPAIREAVLALLRQSAAADDPWTKQAAGAVRDEIESLLDAEPPASEVRLGSWRLIREIGRGGMGVVYLAQRADGAFEQGAAVKRIRRGLDTDEVLARFLRERQILARLQHPGIARLIDGGADDLGRPYFVMEYVEGEPITTYCDRLALTIPQRVRLFLDACRAVEFAHRNLVVHRDLKPSNIIVTADGSVKLLDFGIAKLLSGDATDGADQTLTAMPALTPAYAAPEQIRGEPATTATDVYGLGSVLYELLTGRRTHVLPDASPLAYARAILDHDPEAPSAAADPAR
ncbi:MAG: serine/threonine-protein kinase, partial [Rhodospirillaceae bacterium]